MAQRKGHCADRCSDMQRKEQAEVAQSALHGVFTLPGAGGQRQSRTIALGNLYEAAKISPLAVSPKNFQGAPSPRHL